jgi:hypothetical protein
MTGLIIAFGLLGIAVGHLAGLSDATVVTAVISALFALIGGSLLTFFKEATLGQDRRIITALAAICVGTLIGVHSGIYLKLYAYPVARSRAPLATVLRSGEMNKITEIESLVDHGNITKAEAYERLILLLEPSK